jgi:CRP-like cAMP-binding protein
LAHASRAVHPGQTAVRRYFAGSKWEGGVRVEGLFRNTADPLEVEAGGVIFAHGDAGDTMYGIIEGTVELRVDGRAIAHLGRDDVFGEMAIIDASERMATATATSPTRLAVIDRREFLFLVHETPTFALQVMSTMADRLRLVPTTAAE